MKYAAALIEFSSQDPLTPITDAEMLRINSVLSGLVIDLHRMVGASSANMTSLTFKINGLVRDEFSENVIENRVYQTAPRIRMAMVSSDLKVPASYSFFFSHKYDLADRKKVHEAFFASLQDCTNVNRHQETPAAD